MTSSQAQRKWYSKVITKISYGGYKLGANSANILVQDRITGQINEERMSVYVRLGIRLLYKGLKSKDMEKKRSMSRSHLILFPDVDDSIPDPPTNTQWAVRKLLKGLSFKQGVKYDDPASKAEIQKFIAFHSLDMSEVLLPVESFKSFNEFFYRALKPEARPCSAPDNPRIIVSPADCRSVVFNRMDEATKIWVKGREFSIERLLGSAYPEDAKRYTNGALGIFSLAPQDYHRFHIPVDGVMGTPKTIEGEYYTVNPMAIRSALDVYGENIRVVIPIDSVQHGRVMVICVGAMMVGSTVITRKAGEEVKRAEELGYFKFGGSTILLLFEEGAMRFDDDLVDNSTGALETLVIPLLFFPPFSFFFTLSPTSLFHVPLAISFLIIIYFPFSNELRSASECPLVIIPLKLNTHPTCAKKTRISLRVKRQRLNVGSKAPLSPQLVIRRKYRRLWLVWRGRFFYGVEMCEGLWVR